MVIHDSVITSRESADEAIAFRVRSITSISRTIARMQKDLELAIAKREDLELEIEDLEQVKKEF